jgi:hypothetical protein
MTNYHDWTGEELAAHFEAMEVKPAPLPMPPLASFGWWEYFRTSSIDTLMLFERIRRDNETIRINQKSSDSIG